MAEKVVVQLIDDLDGSEIPDGGGERINFSLRGVDYQIDLSAANIAKLEKTLGRYVAAARKVRGKPAPTTERRGKASPVQLAAVREWAHKNGHQVADRGRIRADVMKAFKAAH